MLSSSPNQMNDSIVLFNYATAYDIIKFFSPSATWRELIDGDTIGWHEVMNNFLRKSKKSEMKKFIAARDFFMLRLNKTERLVKTRLYDEQAFNLKLGSADDEDCCESMKHVLVIFLFD